MALTLNGNTNTIAGLAVGGLPDGTVDAGTLASNSVETAKIASEAVTKGKQGPGSVIQWIQAANADVGERHSESAGNWESTDIHVDITPTDSSNLIIVGGFVSCHSDTTGKWLEIAIHNGTSRDQLMTNGVAYGDAASWYMCPFKYSQIAGTTSQLTFTLWMKNGSTSGNIYIGWSSSPGSTKNWNDIWAAEVVV